MAAVGDSRRYGRQVDPCHRETENEAAMEAQEDPLDRRFTTIDGRWGSRGVQDLAGMRTATIERQNMKRQLGARTLGGQEYPHPLETAEEVKY